mmetsp:Transcript_12948/g.36718  ORF Transcript_12948/g.36718 Transcript_12948/m.36718 type:complete len:212 (-) Transcript_12948:2014-2649(-)
MHTSKMVCTTGRGPEKTAFIVVASEGRVLQREVLCHRGSLLLHPVDRDLVRLGPVELHAVDVPDGVPDHPGVLPRRVLLRAQDRHRSRRAARYLRAERHGDVPVRYNLELLLAARAYGDGRREQARDLHVGLHRCLDVPVVESAYEMVRAPHVDQIAVFLVVRDDAVLLELDVPRVTGFREPLWAVDVPVLPVITGDRYLLGRRIRYFLDH